MRHLFQVLLTLLLFSCANAVETSINESLDGNYEVINIHGENELPEEDIIFNFSPVGNRVSGNTGCNEFSALYNQQGNNLEFSTPMNTRKFCEGKMEIEMQILSSLEKAARLGRNGEEIVIYSTNDVPLLTLIKIDYSE